MKYIFLSQQFYKDYSHCSEIEQKQSRPYVMLVIKIDNLIFALPMRSHIKHNYAFITDITCGCGIDYSKAVVITDQKLYIDNKQPRIRPNEYKALLGKEYIITKQFKKYLSDYKKAVSAKSERVNSQYKYCTLQYFHKELGLI